MRPPPSRDPDSIKPVIIGSLAITMAILTFWFSRLSIIPVPWPDDSAFYLVAKDLFSWPPRWVMLSQAPWEPSYAEWNFNTMPLFPILLGIGRAVGISGSGPSSSGRSFFGRSPGLRSCVSFTAWKPLEH